MADEINAADTNGPAPGNAPRERKPRASRKFEAAEIAGSTSASAPVKKTRGRRKKAMGDAIATATPVSTKHAGQTKAIKKLQSATRGPRKDAATSPFTDDIADFRKLEEENKTLRRALSDKLRAENAELRKKLGM